jgi:hypothetical protein
MDAEFRCDEVLDDWPDHLLRDMAAEAPTISAYEVPPRMHSALRSWRDESICSMVYLRPMSEAGPVAFWSYAHDDNEKSRGAILHLAELIRDEYSLVTGEELGLFIDTRIKWGELWRERIDHALVSTTFLIPVVTPRYFTREECLRELFEFAERAKSLGVGELICPLLYVSVEDLEEDSADPGKALVAKAQYEDWRQLRLKGVDSPEHVEAVHKVALRLAEVAKKVAERQVAREATLGSEEAADEAHVSLEETVGRIREILPKWAEVVEKDSLLREQFYAADEILEGQRAKAKRRPSGARFMVAARQVREYIPLVEGRHEVAQRLLALATQLGPLYRQLFDIVREHPEESDVLREVWKEFSDAGDVYIDHTKDQTIAVAAWARQHSHETRGMLTLAKACEEVDRLKRELGIQFEEWSEGQEALKTDRGEVDAGREDDGPVAGPGDADVARG